MIYFMKFIYLDGKDQDDAAKIVYDTQGGQCYHCKTPIVFNPDSLHVTVDEDGNVIFTCKSSTCRLKDTIPYTTLEEFVEETED